MLSDINESSIRLIQIVNDFLDTSRLEMGKMVFKKEECDIVSLIDETLKEYQTTGSLKMLSLKFEQSKDAIVTIIADKDKTKQILINLVGNAIKYTGKGGVIVTAINDGPFVKVLVADSGVGISLENQALLFRKFQQAGDSIYTRTVSKGTGLGLYISKLIAEGMGGKVKIEKSEVGKGTIFSFSLPIAKGVSYV